MPHPDRPRWRYRFDNFDRAFVLLREAMEIMAERALTPLEREGVIQRFEYSWELAWLVLADYLAHQGLTLPVVAPRPVIRAAFEAGIIADSVTWLDALDARNKMSHTYDMATFEAVIEQLRGRFFDLFDALHEQLMMAALNDDARRD